MQNVQEGYHVERTDPVYTLGVASSLSGIPIPSIRQYIDRGLILPFVKDSKRHLFSDIDIIRLKKIRYSLENEKLNIAGIKALMALIPCWAIRSCTEKERSICQGYHSTTVPCWEASEKGALCMNTDCRECKVYTIPKEFKDVKSLIKEYLK